MMSRRDNTVDKFLNALSRVVPDREKFNAIGLELGFKQYELDPKWTNAVGNVGLAANRMLIDWNNRNISPKKYTELAWAFQKSELHLPYNEVAAKYNMQHTLPAHYPKGEDPPPYESTQDPNKDARLSVEETTRDHRTMPGSDTSGGKMEVDTSQGFVGLHQGGESEEVSCWDSLTYPEESMKWNESFIPSVDSISGMFSQIELPSPEGPYYKLITDSFYNFRNAYNAHAVIINNVCAEFRGRDQFERPEPGRLEKATDRHRDVLKTMGCKVDYGRDMKGNHMAMFLQNLANANFADCNMFWLTVVAHGDEAGKIKDCEKREVPDFTVDRLIEIACRNPSLVGKPKVFFFMACKGLEYDSGQQIALGGTGTVPQILPTFADVLAAFPTWQGQVALFVPNNERNNALEYLNELLEPNNIPRPRSLQKVLQLWKRYHADSIFRTRTGQNVKQTPWVQDSLRDEVYL